MSIPPAIIIVASVCKGENFFLLMKRVASKPVRTITRNSTAIIGEPERLKSGEEGNWALSNALKIREGPKPISSAKEARLRNKPGINNRLRKIPFLFSLSSEDPNSSMLNSVINTPPQPNR